MHKNKQQKEMVYVNTIPECCMVCQWSCPEEENCDSYTCDCNHCKKRPKSCPLALLSEHDKQLKIKTVKDVIGFIKSHKEYYFEERDYYGAKCTWIDGNNLEKGILTYLLGGNNGN